MKTSTTVNPPSTSPFRFARRTLTLRPSAIREILKTTEAPEVISFAGGLPAPELFPVEVMQSAANRIFAEQGAASLQYSVTEGYAPLRRWVSDHLAATIGLHTPPERILITHGSQQGLDLVSKVLLDPGDVVIVENPAYLGALQAFQAHEAVILGVPGDDQGIVPGALEDCIRQAPRPPKLLYLIPNYQNPTGTSLSAARRAEVVEIAARHGIPILEDNPYGELAFDGEPASALSAIGSGETCIYLGTASKILAPGLRVAWIAAPNPVVFDKLVTAKQATDLHTSSFTQRLVFATVQDRSWLAAHIATIRRVYRQRRDVMFRSLERELPAGCEWTHPEGGLFLWLRTPPAINTLELLRLAQRENVAFVPGAPFWVGSAVHNTLRLNFSNAPEDRIVEGIRRLGATVRGALS